MSARALPIELGSRLGAQNTNQDNKGEAIASLRPSDPLQAERPSAYWSFFGLRVSFSILKRIPGGIASLTV